MLKKIAPDKWKHFIVGIGMGAVLQGFFIWILGFSITSASIASFFLSVAISYGFELFSLVTRRGHYELWDAMAGVLGALIGMGGVTLLTTMGH
jgi:hypothetical protein